MNFFRRIAERIGRGIVLKRVMRVNGKAVELFVSPDAQLKYLKPGNEAFDRDLIRIAERFVRSDSTVWDVGANVGTFTFASASIAREGTVVSMEPDVWLSMLIRNSRNLASNRDRDIRCISAAVSEENSIASFLIAERGRASNALELAMGRTMMGGVREKVYVPTLTLDTLLTALPEPDFVKIDVEGAEAMVIRGARTLIGEHRPVFYVEVNEKTAPEILGVFRKSNYVAVSPQGDLLEDACEFNTLFVPKEDGAALELALEEKVSRVAASKAEGTRAVRAAAGQSC